MSSVPKCIFRRIHNKKKTVMRYINGEALCTKKHFEEKSGKKGKPKKKR
jgi:hypothetical protein